jgi:hypothetical protein
MKSEQWKTYRTRFLVKAKQLSSSLSFVDHLGRQHCGRKGDYLVESSDGVLSIAPRRIFEDIYVCMPLLRREPAPEAAIGETKPDHPIFEALKVEEIKLPNSPAALQRSGQMASVRQNTLATDATPRHDTATPGDAARGRRKLPQLCHVHPSSSSYGLM